MKLSAGLVIFRYYKKELQVLLVHPGGPFYAKKDAGVWSIPKGEYSEGEDALSVAKREFQEETGNIINDNLEFTELIPVKIKSGKIISAWAVECNFEKPFISSNYFKTEWPPHSGKLSSFTETDNALYFNMEDARNKILNGQSGFLDQLIELVK